MGMERRGRARGNGRFRHRLRVGRRRDPRGRRAHRSPNRAVAAALQRRLGAVATESRLAAAGAAGRLGRVENTPDVASFRMSPGEIVELRSVYRGRVRWAFPHRVVADDGDRFALYIAPGTEGVWMGRDADGRYLERWMSDEPPYPHVWRWH